METKPGKIEQNRNQSIANNAIPYTAVYPDHL